jgi:hypothetical protein
MPLSRIKIDQDAINDLARQAAAKVQSDYDAIGQNVIRSVNAEMAGQPAEDVLAALRARIRAAGLEPNDDGLRAAAAAIASRSLA